MRVHCIVARRPSRSTALRQYIPRHGLARRSHWQRRQRGSVKSMEEAQAKERPKQRSTRRPQRPQTAKRKLTEVLRELRVLCVDRRRSTGGPPCFERRLPERVLVRARAVNRRDRHVELLQVDGQL